MSVGIVLVAAALLQTPQVELQTLSDETHSGVLTELSSAGAVVTTPDGSLSISAEDLLEVEFSGNEPVPPPRRHVQLTLTDGSSITCTSCSTTPRQAKFEMPGIGTVKIPVRSLQTMRFQALDEAVSQSWDELRQRESKSDILVIRKEKVLDFLPGIIGALDDKSVKFLLDGDERIVPREKIFGLIYYHRNARRSSKTGCSLSLVNGDLLRARTVDLEQGAIVAKLSAGGTATLPVASIRLLDFSGGKVVYLSSMEPRDVKYTPFYDIIWEYRNDRTGTFGRPITLFGKTYRRGLCIHSKTKLTYRLRGDFRRFRAVMGIDQGVEGKGNVDVVISADGKVLEKARVTGLDKQPHLLDLDVSGVRDLQILVDYGDHGDEADHLDLADARVIK